MGKRYFCDYCDRSFQDNLHNRKKHLNGVQHLRAKRVWYDLFRDAAAILQEEQTKKPCRKFLQTGQCDFGSNCRFSHMTEQDLEKLSAQVQGEKRLKELRQEGADIPPGTIEDWLEKRAQRLSAAQSNSLCLSCSCSPTASPGLSCSEVVSLPLECGSVLSRAPALLRGCLLSPGADIPCFPGQDPSPWSAAVCTARSQSSSTLGSVIQAGEGSCNQAFGIDV
ncbi:zinc finger matrin-type protein 5 isoform X1 [Pipra filicauda]|uniref:Zinc finger matrin-type protein 5 n=2 Tax=Passeriformes TaxID=9126 RepID=A0A7R5KQT4_9PASS|nr:zinc finger matrin-type protein 5 isoform X1 [Pipra filicauda]XP_039242920.1 zinc finger matrin-type protein 5 isoform X1 [Pipra filicauda]